MNREQVHVHATFHGFLSNHIYVHATFSKNFVSMPHSWPWLEHSCPFSPCPYPPHSALLLERVIQWPIFIEVNHYINTLSHKDFPWLGHGTDFFLRFLNQDCSKNYRYLRFSHYAHVILHIENLRKKHHEGNQLFKKKGPDTLLSAVCWIQPIKDRILEFLNFRICEKEFSQIVPGCVIMMAATPGHQ